MTPANVAPDASGKPPPSNPRLGAAWSFLAQQKGTPIHEISSARERQKAVTKAKKAAKIAAHAAAAAAAAAVAAAVVPDLPKQLAATDRVMCLF